MRQVTLPLTVKITVDKRSKDAPYVAYSPEVDVASCGPTEKRARENLKDAILAVLEEIRSKRKLEEFFKKQGFESITLSL